MASNTQKSGVALGLVGQAPWKDRLTCRGDELASGPRVQSAQRVLDVLVGRRLADTQDGCDLAIGRPLRDQLDDLSLPWRERRFARGTQAGARKAGDHLDEPGQQAAGKGALAMNDGGDRTLEGPRSAVRPLGTDH